LKESFFKIWVLTVEVEALDVGKGELVHLNSQMSNLQILALSAACLFCVNQKPFGRVLN